MKISISDPATLRRVIALAKQVDAHDASIAATDEAVAELKSRRASLARRLAEHRASQPDASIVADDALVDAIAADPSSRPGGGAYDAALDRQRAAREATDEWQVNLSVLEAAVGKLDREVAAARAKREDLDGGRYASWVEFVRGAHAALADEFARQFADLRDNVMVPMKALCEARDATGLGTIATTHTPQFTSKTVVELQRFDPIREGVNMLGATVETGGKLVTDRLFPALPSSFGSPPYAAQIETFRTALIGHASRRA